MYIYILYVYIYIMYIYIYYIILYVYIYMYIYIYKSSVNGPCSSFSAISNDQRIMSMTLDLLVSCCHPFSIFQSSGVKLKAGP